MTAALTPEVDAAGRERHAHPVASSDKAAWAARSAAAAVASGSQAWAAVMVTPAAVTMLTTAPLSAVTGASLDATGQRRTPARPAAPATSTASQPDCVTPRPSAI